MREGKLWIWTIEKIRGNHSTSPLPKEWMATTFDPRVFHVLLHFHLSFSNCFIWHYSFKVVNIIFESINYSSICCIPSGYKRSCVALSKFSRIANAPLAFRYPFTQVHQAISWQTSPYMSCLQYAPWALSFLSLLPH